MHNNYFSNPEFSQLSQVSHPIGPFFKNMGYSTIIQSVRSNEVVLPFPTFAKSIKREQV